MAVKKNQAVEAGMVAVGVEKPLSPKSAPNNKRVHFNPCLFYKRRTFDDYP
jgi:hypothetical protein